MSEWLVKKGSALLQARTSRRGFLLRAAMAGTALSVSPVRYLFRPGTAYAAICGCGGYDCDCGSACCDGYSAFCCEVNGGANACPSGTFPGGWWRADGSVFCDGTRYIVDCNAHCGSGYGCTCAQGDCGRRVSACNWFRYGQCNDHITCAGPIVCRMATCEPPYNLDLGCSSDTFWDDYTANHSADCSTTTAAPGGGGGGGGEAPPEEPGPELSERELERLERSQERDAERAERSRQRDEERAERSRQRDAERGD
jgi:hypothetical protein